MYRNIPGSRFSILLALVLALAPVASHAGEDPPSAGGDPLHLAGRHALAVRVGTLTLGSRSTLSPEGVRTGTSTDVLGELSYSRWLAEDWSIGLSAGSLMLGAETGISPGVPPPTAADDASGVVRFRSATVTAVLLNVGYHPTRLAIGRAGRPYFSLSLGPYLGSGENVRAGTDAAGESVTDTAFGLRALAGVDLYLGRRFKVGLGAGYRFVDSFDEPIRSYRDYSGPEFSLGFGILLGGGR